MLPLVQDTPPPYPDGKIHVTQEDWDKFKGAVERDPGLTEAERFSFMETYGAEGGMAVDGSSGASSGITPALMEKAKTDGVIPAGVEKPQDLSPEQRVAVYKWFFDTEIFQALAGGGARLEDTQNHFTTAAVADTMFRHGRGEGARLIQRAINEVVGSLRDVPTGQPVGVVRVDGVLGSRTFRAIVELSTGGYGPQLRDALADRRRHSQFGGERWRIDHFHFPGMP
ncbi:MAG: hypothetical protein ACT4P2_06325 [Pseudomonadota bacterium]